MKSLQELLSIYAKAYVHYLKDNYEYDEYVLYEQSKKIAKFGNMIATDPFSELTQKKALFYEEEMNTYHSEVIKNIPDKNYDERIFPCRCLKKYIKDRVKELEKKVFEDNEDNKDNEDEIYNEYQAWLMYDNDESDSDDE